MTAWEGCGPSRFREKMVDARSLLDAGEAVAGVLARHKIGTVIIGAVALAAHRHIRYTEDLDLDVNANVAVLRAVPNARRRRVSSGAARTGFAGSARWRD